MNHPEIEERKVLERYLRDELEADELGQFEEHLLTCESCLDEAEAEERFGRGLRSLSASQELPVPWHRAALPWAWAASLAIALLPAWYLHRQGQASWHQLLEQRQAGHEQQHSAQGQLADLRAELTALRGELEASQGSAGSAAGAAPESDSLERLRRQLEEATRPQANVAVLRLEPVRSSDRETPYRLTLSDQPEWVVLSLQPPIDAASYSLELSSPEGSVVWRQSGLETDAYGALIVSLYSPQLGVGVHRLELVPENAAPGAAFESSFEVRR